MGIIVAGFVGTEPIEVIEEIDHMPLQEGATGLRVAAELPGMLDAGLEQAALI